MSEHNNRSSSDRKPAGGPMRGRGPMGRGHGPMAMMQGEKARDFKGTMNSLLDYLGAYKIAIAIVMLIAIASTIFSIAGPKILGKATTKLFEGVMDQIAGTGTGIDFDYIGRIILITLALYLVSAFLSLLQGWIMSGISMDITYRFRKDIAAKINRMPFKYFDSTSQGDVLSRITNDVDTISQTLNQSLSQIITSVVTVVGVLVMMLSISWQMPLIALLIMPLSMVIIALVVRQSQKYFKQQQEFLGRINGHVEEMFGGHLVMKAFNGEARSVERFDGFNETLYDSAWKSQFLSGLMFPIMNFVGNLAYVGIAIFGGYLATQNAITIGDIQAFIQYVNSFTRPLSQIANISNVLQQTAAAAERVFEFLDEEEEVSETAHPVELKEVRGQVEFRDVQFGYSPDKIVIKDFTKIDMSDQDIYEKMNTSLETSSKKNSLHVNPRFCGTRENPKLHGSITNIGSDNFLPDHLIHAFAKAMIEELCDMIPSTYRRNFSTIIASGNAIRKNPAIMNVIAQSFGKSVCLAKFCEEATVGAAIMANHNRIKSVPLHAPKP